MFSYGRGTPVLSWRRIQLLPCTAPRQACLETRRLFDHSSQGLGAITVERVWHIRLSRPFPALRKRKEESRKQVHARRFARGKKDAVQKRCCVASFLCRQETTVWSGFMRFLATGKNETTTAHQPAILGFLTHKKQPPPLRPPQEPRHRPTVGSS